MYSWSSSVVVFTPNTAWPLLTVGTDGIYLEYTDLDLGPESSSSLDAGLSLGGANALAKYSFSGALQWIIPLPVYSQSLDRIPGGGVIIGEMIGADLYYVTGSGQVVASEIPLSTSDWLDYAGGAVSVTRNPQDGMLDVFAEDIGYSYNSWYRIDDATPDVVYQGEVAPGQVVHLRVAPSTPSAPTFLSAYGAASDGVPLTNSSRPSFGGEAQPGDTIELLLAPGTVVGKTTVGAAGSYTVVPSSPLANGTYVFQILAVDPSGDVSAPSSAFSLTIDTTIPAAPPVPALLPADDSGTIGDGITNINRPRLTGSALAGSTVELWIAGVVVGMGTATGGTVHDRARPRPWPTEPTPSPPRSPTPPATSARRARSSP